MRNICGLSIALLLVLSCAHQQEARVEAAATPTPAVVAPVPSPAPAEQRSCADDDRCGPKELCIRQQCVAISLGLAECSTVRVHFDFDKSDIRDDDKPALVRIGRCLRAEHALKVTIEGNADERGTEEYNLALGQRRATVVDKYLEALDVSSAQLKTVTYGYEKPVCSEHNETCWAKNRRAAVKAK